MTPPADPTRPNTAPWPLVRALFERLLDGDAAARRAALAEADPAIAAEVRSLLDQHDAVEQRGSIFLAEPATLAATPPGARRSGQRLGPWRLTSLLGEGGMGQVWEAFRADGRYDARVAVKVLKSGSGSAAVLERFALEQRTLARLEHPHIARLLDAGLTPDGAPYFVLEAVQGLPIDAACAGQPLRTRLRLFLQLADAVAFAHRHLLVHRDLKPGNVLVTDDGLVKLLDFGIARALSGEGGSGGADNPDGTMLGLTPAFASPEQVRGAPVGTATDVYSLGLLLHLMLTGSRAYGRDARSTAEALAAVIDEVPPAPSQAPPGARDGGVARAQLRGDIDAIVGRCLKKDAEARYPSVDALAADVKAWMDGKPVVASSPTPLQRAWKFVLRNRAASAAAAVALGVLILGLAAQAGRVGDKRDTIGAVAGLALVALAVGVGISAWQARRAAAARDQAEARLQGTRAIARDIVLRYADTISYLPGGAQLKASLLGDTIAHLERLGTAAYSRAGDDAANSRAEDNAALAGDLAMTHARLADIQVVDTDLTLNDPDACRGNVERALALFPRGEAAHRSDPRYVMWWARTMHNQANLARAAGDAEAGLRWRERQRDLLLLAAPRFPGDRDLQSELGSAWIGIGQAYDTWSLKSLDRPDAAATAQDAARVVYEGLVASDPNDSAAWHQLGVIEGGRLLSQFKLARLHEAAEHGRRAVAHKRRALAIDPANTAYRQGLSGESNNLAMVLNEAGLFVQAEAAAREALELLRALERDDPTLPIWPQRRRYFSLHWGRALLGCGRAEEALVPLEECLAESAHATTLALRRRRGLNLLLLSQARLGLGQADAAAHAAAEAEALLRVVQAEDNSDPEALSLLAEVLLLRAGEDPAVARESVALFERAAALAPLRRHALQRLDEARRRTLAAP